MVQKNTVRRPVANLSIWGTTYLHKRDPLIIACWSLTFPGYGHILLHKYTRGFALIIWEVFINQISHLNEAMVYSFIGEIDKAKQVLGVNFVFMYIPLYLFAIWDSHRSAVGLNDLHVLAETEDQTIKALTVKPFEVNYLDKRKPVAAIWWSMLFPSLGQLYLHQVFSAIFTLITIVVFNYYSHFVESLYYLLLGDIQKSTRVLDMQWLMYLPSLYFFSIYETYVNTVENNKLFDAEQRRFLIKNYQSSSFKVQKGVKVK